MEHIESFKYLSPEVKKIISKTVDEETQVKEISNRLDSTYTEVQVEFKGNKYRMYYMVGKTVMKDLQCPQTNKFKEAESLQEKLSQNIDKVRMLVKVILEIVINDSMLNIKIVDKKKEILPDWYFLAKIREITNHFDEHEYENFLLRSIFNSMHLKLLKLVIDKGEPNNRVTILPNEFYFLTNQIKDILKSSFGSITEENIDQYFISGNPETVNKRVIN